MSMKKGDKSQHWMRNVQKSLFKAASYVIDTTGKAADVAKDVLQDIDKAAGISEKAKEVGGKVREQVQELDERYGLKEKSTQVVAYTSEKIGHVADAGKELVEKSGAKELAEQAVQLTRDAIVTPTKEAISRAGIDEVAESGLNQLEQLYGKTREAIKPYFAAEDTRELLTNTKTELAKGSACLMRISSSNSEKLAGQFSSAVLAKATGAAATTTLLTLVCCR